MFLLRVMRTKPPPKARTSSQAILMRGGAEAPSNMEEPNLTQMRISTERMAMPSHMLCPNLWQRGSVAK